MSKAEQKRCPRCGLTKLKSRCFQVNQGWCRACCSAHNRSAHRRAQLKASRKKPEYVAKARRRDFGLNLLNRYGITVEDWARMYERQGGRCACCSTPLPIEKNTHVDHCHATGRFRGLLCSCCNQALGNVGDSTLTLRAMITYIEGA